MNFSKINNAQIKLIRLLQTKKYRQKYDQFIVEGVKNVKEFVASEIPCLGLYAEPSIFHHFDADLPPNLCFETKSKQLAQISALTSPQDVLGVFKLPKFSAPDFQASFILALEDIRDPGNMGTIIRTADWFGLKEIVCSLDSVDCFNPKVVQASMGSLSRIKVHYTDLLKFSAKAQDHQLILTDMKGTDYKSFQWTKNILVIGNEGKGISEGLRSLAHEKLTIPRLGQAESLNAGISAAIILASRF